VAVHHPRVSPGFPGKRPGCPRTPRSPYPVPQSPTPAHFGPPNAAPPARRGRHGRGGQGGRQGGTREIPGFPGGQICVQRGHPGAFKDFPTEHPGGTPRFSRGSPGIIHSVKLGLQTGAGGFRGYSGGVSGVSPGCPWGVPGVSPGCPWEDPGNPGDTSLPRHGGGDMETGGTGESSEEFRRAHVDFSEYIRGCSGKAPGESWEISGNAPGDTWECPGRVLGDTGEIPGNRKNKKIPRPGGRGAGELRLGRGRRQN
jgi:hypothetical protein